MPRRSQGEDQLSTCNLANSIFDQAVDAERSGQPALPPASNSKDNESTSGDAERSLATETSRSQPVSRLGPGAARAPSPELQGTSPGPSESYLPILADAEHPSAGTGVPNPTTSLDHIHGLREASRPDDQCVSDIPRKPTPPILAPRPSNKFELRVFPDKHSVINDAFLKCTPYIVNLKYMVLIVPIADIVSIRIVRWSIYGVTTRIAKLKPLSLNISTKGFLVWFPNPLIHPRR